MGDSCFYCENNIEPWTCSVCPECYDKLKTKIKQLEADYKKTVKENQKQKKLIIFLLKWVKDHLKYMNNDYISSKRNFENELKVLEGK